MKLPIAGQRSSATNVVSEELAETSVPHALVLIPAYPAAPIWSLIRDVPSVLYLGGEGKGNALGTRAVERPQPHIRVSGSRRVVVDHVLAVSILAPVVLVGPNVRWIRPGFRVLFAGSLGRHSWTAESRRLPVDLVLRDVRPVVIQKLLKRLQANAA